MTEWPNTVIDARAIGSRMYFTGKPCKYGHVSIRYTNTRICLDCTRMYANEFYHANKERCSQSRKQYYETHKQRAFELSKAWANDNRERRRQIVNRSTARRKHVRRAWEERNRETLLQKKREYWATNKERLKAWHREYKKSNKEKINADCSYRRAIKRGAEGRYTKDDVMALWNKQNGLCTACFVDLSVSGKHVDHVIALSRGGSNWPVNLQLLCPTCNLRKYTKSGVLA